MIRSLIQFDDGARGVAAMGDDGARRVTGATTTLALANEAMAAGISLAHLAATRLGESIDLGGVTLLCPIDHSDPAHLLVSGTGLTHLGSAEGRDQMHRAAIENPAPTDSMKMFLMGVEGGKPETGSIGVQPEWFYKGDGAILAAPDAPLAMPDFALDGGEEPEIAGVYIVDPSGQPRRIGMVAGNEFSDHVFEKKNYLYLASSKLRTCWSAVPASPISARPRGATRCTAPRSRTRRRPIR